MDNVISDVLAEYEQRARQERVVMESLSREEQGKRVDEFLLYVGPETGKLLHTLIVGAKSQVIVEVGASYGYSTVWLADAARATGGKVHSLELSADKVAHGRSQLQRAGLLPYVEHHVGDARATLEKLDGGIDFVLLDLWKDLYLPCFELFHPKLSQGAFIAADNMINPPSTRELANAYRERVRQSGQYDTMLLPVGSGIELSKRR